jgi:hypothetical protein
MITIIFENLPRDYDYDYDSKRGNRLGNRQSNRDDYTSLPTLTKSHKILVNKNDSK